MSALHAQPPHPNRVFTAEATFQGRGGMIYEFEKTAFTTPEALVQAVQDQLSKLDVDATVDNVDAYIAGLQAKMFELVAHDQHEELGLIYSNRLSFVNPSRSRAVKIPFKLTLKYLTLL